MPGSVQATRPAPAEALRALPQVQRLLDLPAARPLAAAYSHDALVRALRAVLDAARREVLAAGAPPPDADALLERAAAVLAAADRPALRRAVNGTGIVLHTNLGRAPLAESAVAAMSEIARGYGNLEFDLETGRRGARNANIEALLREVTGAAAGVAVNNNAAAVLLALSALAAGGEVIVSRGELVEIGGGFRVPDVIQQGGARLVEVGTTNRTRLADYARAITPQTRMLLKVHPSNYRLVGFTEATGLAALAALAREHGLLLMEDLGSGVLPDLRTLGRPYEPTVRESLVAGADLVAFSGDKLLGGPQAGILVGASRAIDPLRRHPLMRALRLDKTSLAALEATLILHRDPDRARRDVPALRMLAQDEATLERRADVLCRTLAAIPGAEAAIVPSTGYAGGGTLPDAAIASRAVAVSLPDLAPDALALLLRRGTPAVIGRVAGERFLLDLLTVADSEFSEIAASLRRIAERGSAA